MQEIWASLCFLLEDLLLQKDFSSTEDGKKKKNKRTVRNEKEAPGTCPEQVWGVC